MKFSIALATPADSWKIVARAEELGTLLSREEGKPLAVLYVLLDGRLSVSLAALGGKEIARLNRGFTDFCILHGVESDGEMNQERPGPSRGPALRSAAPAPEQRWPGPTCHR